MGQAAPIYLAIASAVVAEANNRKTARKQDRVVAEGIRQQGETQRKANARINESLQFAEDSNPNDERRDINSDFLDAIRRNSMTALQGLNREGAVSDEYEEGALRAGGLATDYAGTVADLFSRIDAPVEQRRGEHANFGDLGSSLNVLGRESEMDKFLTDLKLSRIRPNPWLSILSAGLGGASSATAANGGARSPGWPKWPSTPAARPTIAPGSGGFYGPPV